MPRPPAVLSVQDEHAFLCALRDCTEAVPETLLRTVADAAGMTPVAAQRTLQMLLRRPHDVLKGRAVRSRRAQAAPGVVGLRGAGKAAGLHVVRVCGVGVCGTLKVSIAWDSVAVTVHCVGRGGGVLMSHECVGHVATMNALTEAKFDPSVRPGGGVPL